MFPDTMNTTNIQKVSELWENEKKYRWWIVGFAFSLFALFSCYLTLVILSYNFREDLLIHFSKFANPNSSVTVSDFANGQFQGLVLSLIGMSIGLFLSTAIFCYSIYNCYKAKSFEKLDSISSFFLGFQTFFTFFTLINIFISTTDFNIIAGSNIMIMDFTLKFLLIPVWLLLSREVKKIKRTFFIAKRQEEIKAFYEANPNQMGPGGFNNPFQQQGQYGFPFQKANNPDPVNSENEETKGAADINVVNEKYSKLEGMTFNQLVKIADKLSISGSKEMEKPELIKIIIAVSESLKANEENQDHDVDKNKDDKEDIKDLKSQEAKDLKAQEAKEKKDLKLKESKEKKDLKSSESKESKDKKSLKIKLKKENKLPTEKPTKKSNKDQDKDNLEK